MDVLSWIANRQSQRKPDRPFPNWLGVAKCTGVGCTLQSCAAGLRFPIGIRKVLERQR